MTAVKSSFCSVDVVSVVCTPSWFFQKWIRFWVAFVFSITVSHWVVLFVKSSLVDRGSDVEVVFWVIKMMSVGDCDFKPTNKNLSRSWSQVDSVMFFSQDHPGQGFHGTESRNEIQTGEDHRFCTVKIHAQNCIRTTKGRWAVQAVHQQSSNWVDKYRSPTKLRTKLLFSAKRKNKRSSWVSCFPGHWMKLENSWWLFDDG